MNFAIVHGTCLSRILSCNEPSLMNNCQFLILCSSLCLFEEWSVVSIIAAGHVFETSWCICPCTLV